MIVPFLFSVTPATPPIETVAPIVVAATPPTAAAPQTFAGLLLQICQPEQACHPERSEGSASAEKQIPRSAQDDNVLAWAAYILMPVVSPPPVTAAEASPALVAASASPVVIPATVERAIATTVEPLGVDASAVVIESVITADEAPTTPAIQPAPSDSTPAIQSDTSLLEPRVRARVERVITRARTELGLQVVVRETLRSQERQDALFAQGRTEPGEVVTWTRRSLHTDGLAADLEIVSDGAPSELPVTKYERLAKIANEEGLTTLGPRDPGHVEFRGGTVLHQTVIPRRNDLKLVPLGKVAPVEAAPVARPEVVVAPKPAAPALVARVIAPSDDGHPERSDESVPADVQIPRFTQDDNAARHDNHVVIPTATPTLTVSDSSWHEPAVTTTNIAARIEEIHSIADIVADRPVTGVVLRLDGNAGDGDHIRIDVRRNVVETSVRAADPTLTHRLVADAPVLRSALERQGLEVGRIEVRSQMLAVGDAQPRAFDGRRERESSPESYRRSQQNDSRQRQRRNPNQNGESQR